MLAVSTSQHMQRQLALLQELLERFRERELGGRVFSCTTGSAPSAAEVLLWLDDVMGFPALNGYGSTECGVTILNNKVVAKWVPFTFPLGACSFAVCNLVQSHYRLQMGATPLSHGWTFICSARPCRTPPPLLTTAQPDACHNAISLLSWGPSVRRILSASGSASRLYTDRTSCCVHRHCMSFRAHELFKIGAQRKDQI